MTKFDTSLSTGVAQLDEVIQGVKAGDNIVWKLDSIEDYIKYVHPFCKDADRTGKKLIYFRFAEHARVIPDNIKVDQYNLNP